MEQDIKVSIITVCLNSAETIRNTIESVLAQTYTNISYYIVDGQSSDGTPDIAESYREAFTGKGMRLFISSEKNPLNLSILYPYLVTNKNDTTIAIANITMN